MKIGRGVRQECCLSPILLNLFSIYVTNEALEGFGGKQILPVKYAHELLQQADDETVLQNMINRLIDI